MLRREDGGVACKWYREPRDAAFLMYHHTRVGFVVRRLLLSQPCCHKEPQQTHWFPKNWRERFLQAVIGAWSGVNVGVNLEYKCMSAYVSPENFTQQ